jgi:hypothetical protein
MNQESLVKEQKDYQAIGGEISHELAAKMVKDHNDKNSMENSYSYVIGKNIIEQVLSQPGCVGVRFFDAINEANEKTLVFVGIDSKGKSIIEITTVNGHGKLVVTPGMLNDQILAPHPLNWLSL